MTKKDYEALAAALKTTKPPTNADAYARQQWRDDVLAVIGVLEQTNPRFNKGRFIAACGVPNILDDGITAEMRKVVINYHTTDEGE